METESKQYTLIKEAREVLFQYCETFSGEDYLKEVEKMGRGSIRNTQVHIADTYIHWIGNFALGKNLSYIDPKTVTTVAEARTTYLKINKLIDEFITAFYDQETETIKNKTRSDDVVAVTPLALFTHVITHEFHHKGQLVSMSRMLGYTPPDTDLIRS